MQADPDIVRIAEKLKGWLAGLDPNRPLAVVIGASCNGLSFVRSLGRRRIPTLLLDSNRLLGTFTRFGKVVLLPPVDQSPLIWIEFLRLVGRRLPVPAVLFATSDPHCLLISKHRSELEPYFRFLFASEQTMETILNKRLQYQAAQAADIPIPQAYFPQSFQEAAELATGLRYPCLLKPYFSSARAKLGKKVVVVNSPDELQAAFQQITAMNLPVMIQQLVSGDDSALFGYLALWDHQGREIAWLTKRKLRQNPPGFGDGSLQQTIHAPEVTDLSRRFLRALNYCGFVGVEFKLDAETRTFRLIEVNPRTVIANQLAITAGVDFPWIGYQLLMGRDIRPVSFRTGVKFVHESWDFQAYLALRKTGRLSLAGWLSSLCSAQSRALWACNDPMPFFAGVVRLFRVLIGTFGRRLTHIFFIKQPEKDHHLEISSPSLMDRANPRA